MEPLGHRNNRSSFASRDSLVKKIELPNFDGSKPYCWISQAERYFRAAKYEEDEKMEIVALSLIGPVLHWYSWEVTVEAFQTWENFKEHMLDRFAESIDDEPGNRLCALTGSVRAYVSE